MAFININVAEKPNTPPTINNISVTGSNRITRPILMTDFTDIGGYSDAEADALGRVLIESLPSQGTLVNGTGNTPVVNGQQITDVDIIAGNFKYIPIDGNPATLGNFNFRVSDVVDPSNFSGQRQFQIQIPEPPTYGYGVGTGVDIKTSSAFSVIFNWNAPEMNNYQDFNLGILRTDSNYSQSPRWNYGAANKIVIESFTDDIIVTNASVPLFWNNFTLWSPLPVGFNQKQILDASTGLPITLPYTLNLPGGNSPVVNVGLKVDFALNEFMVPTTSGTSYSSFTTSVRRMIVGYKIYSNNIAQTPTLYHMWYRAAIKP